MTSISSCPQNLFFPLKHSLVLPKIPQKFSLAMCLDLLYMSWFLLALGPYLIRTRLFRSYYVILSYHIISYHIVDLKWQNRLKAETDKTKLKVKMRSVSDDVRKRLVEKPRRKVYSNCEGVTSSGRTGRSRSLL